MIAADPHLDGECLDDDFGGLAASEEEGAT
jgi:hypothetical protein